MLDTQGCRPVMGGLGPDRVSIDRWRQRTARSAV